MIQRFCWGNQRPRILPLAMALACGVTVLFVNGSAMAADGDSNEPVCTQQQTAASSSSASLPDGRQWEMVSPISKCSAAVEALTYAGGGAVQAAEDGEGIAWLGDGSIEAEPAGNRSLELSQVLSRRDQNGGWSSQDIALPNDAATGIKSGSGDGYRLFSPNLSAAVVEPPNATALAAEATEQTLYLRNDQTSAFVPLVDSANVTSGEKFSDALEFSGATSSLGDLALTSSAALTTGATTGEGLYMWTNGTLRLVSILPEGANGNSPKLAGEFHGGDHGDVRDAISEGGMQVFFGAENSAAEYNLYVRDLNTESTTQIDAAQGIAQPTETLEPLEYQMASVSGSNVFFTAGGALTSNATARQLEPDLYVYNFAKGTLTDLTADANSGEYADVLGQVLGGSESGEIIYFVAGGVLTNAQNQYGATAVAGEDNLYVEREKDGAWESPTFVATLSKEDERDWIGNQGEDLYDMTAGVSDNGQYLAFMSDRDIADYSSIDSKSGEADEEVYLYDVNTGRLSCPSCEPSHAPVGAYDSQTAAGRGPLVDRPNLWTGRWLAANIPGWVSVNLHQAFYQPRYLSNSGRLFFNSPQALVPEDVNGTWDVYEYEPVGVGSCTEVSTTFRAAKEGCISLISPGTAPSESAFVDASATGNDAFFETSASLTSDASGTGLKLYDAHVCTVEAPCPTASDATTSPCETADACKEKGHEQSSTLAAPASVTFTGAGNVDQPATVGAPSTKTGVPKQGRAKRLSRALQRCRAMYKRKARRHHCERSARTRYGTVSAREVHTSKDLKRRVIAIRPGATLHAR